MVDLGRGRFLMSEVTLYLTPFPKQGPRITALVSRRSAPVSRGGPTIQSLLEIKDTHRPRTLR